MSSQAEDSRVLNPEERPAETITSQTVNSSQKAKKSSKIPTRLLTPRKTTHQKAKDSPEKTSGNGEMSFSVPSSKPPPSASRTRVRHVSTKDRKQINGVTPGKLKENVAPNATGTIGNGTSSTRVKHSLKSNMSYMELKRRHQDLVLEVEAREHTSKETEGQHSTEIRQLMEEIAQFRESNMELGKKIHAYKGVIKERNQLLDSLQQQLEDIKFENERMAAILEGSRLDAFTGERVERATEFHNTLPEKEFELEAREQTLDGFISTLETTITQLQEQKQTITDCTQW